MSHNPELEAIPSEVGWLPLSRLELGDNPRLRMPEIVIERGFRCGGRDGCIGGRSGMAVVVFRMTLRNMRGKGHHA